MARYSKDDIEFHSDRMYSPRRPAINVKVYNWGYDADDLMADEPALDRQQAEKIIDWCFEAHREFFWDDDAGYLAEEILGRGYQVYSEGRSGGWLIVQGLEDVDSWDAIMVSKWGRFEKAIKGQVEYLCSKEAIKETIEANEWVASVLGREEGVEVQ